MSDDDLEVLLDNRFSKCSKNVIKVATNTLSEYARSRGDTLTRVEQMSAINLDKYLARFYAEVRKTDGTEYARGSMVSLKYGLQQHFKKTIWVDIINSDDFKVSNSMFIHKNPLSTDDFIKLHESDALNTGNPSGLQHKVLSILWYICATEGVKICAECTNPILK